MEGEEVWEQEYNCGGEDKVLTREEEEALQKQDSRLVTPFTAQKMTRESQKHWDLFYKRNQDKFFKDRHWTAREFEELRGGECSGTSRLLEVGCGVGNLVLPLLQSNTQLSLFACDFSPRAVQILKESPLYNPARITAFQADITEEGSLSELTGSMDIITLVFVLSAIAPDRHVEVLSRLYDTLRPGGVLLFRDYGLYDMAQIRFKPGHKISQNLYLRQDGTRSYFFSVKELDKLFKEAGFSVLNLCYVQRRTVNKKEGIDVPRRFVQAKLTKPS